MPEYLSPGVYVEEIDTGSKPIEGVSTSTAGMVGLTERGPRNVPILVTGPGDYARWFGGLLDRDDYRNDGLLPDAVDGFFRNGGRRLYVTRVAPTEATEATRNLYFAPTNLSLGETVLLRAAREGTGQLGTPSFIVLSTQNFSAAAQVRIGDGSRAEYRELAFVGGTTRHVPLNQPLAFAHEDKAAFRSYAVVELPNFTGNYTLAEDVPAGAVAIQVDAGGVDLTTIPEESLPALVEIASPGVTEYAQLSDVPAQPAVQDGPFVLNLGQPLTCAHTVSTTIRLRVLPNLVDFPNLNGDYTLAEDVAAGATTILVSSTNNLADINQTFLIEIASSGLTEYAQVSDAPDPPQPAGGPFTLVLDQPLVTAHTVGSTTIRLRSLPNPVPRTRVLDGAAAAGDVMMFATTDGGGTGQIIEIEPGIAGRHEIRLQGALVQLDLRPAAYADYPARSTVEHVAVVDLGQAPARQLRAAAEPRAVAIEVDDRTGLAAGDVVRIGAVADPGREYAIVAALPGAGMVVPDPGQVVLELPLRAAHANNTEVLRQSEPTPAANANPTARLVLDTKAGGVSVFATDGTGYAAGQLVRVTVPDGTVAFHQVSGAAATTPGEVTLDAPLAFSHAAGAPLVERAALLDVTALDVGAWGNRLQVSVEAEEPGLVTGAHLTGTSSPLALALSTLNGIESGTVLELVDPATGAVIDLPLKVRRLDRGASNPVVLAPDWGLTPAHLDAINTSTEALIVRSREFRLTVRLRRLDDPAIPSRGDQIIDSEGFRHLSMDPRHSRYAVRILGDVAGPRRRSDRRPEGESAYVRLKDLRPVADREAVSLGPEVLTDLMPSGLVRAARHPLTGGDDSLATLADPVFIGTDDREPENRTGIAALKNIDDISIVACPGRTTVPVQQALINHCEELRYRFAVLDGPPPPEDAMADVQALRQSYDSKYAAIYHPWLLIPDAMPDNLASIAQVPIPPSGHVMGIYARTDIERGVHKAPANEVVRGITGLSRYLNKAEHDILNPFPVNINVIRDFRPDNRAIRVWGARVVTSDPDYKYLNVRRLMISLEAAIYRGLQWPVFEPNAQPLWARVRRSIGNFLTQVWRDGALEGTKPEEAFFVICDRTTMTQADIDNGRLICVIGVAPVKPAEFVIIRIGLKTAQAED